MKKIILALLFLCCSCSKAPESPSEKKQPSNSTIFSGQAMTMNYKIIIGQILNQEEEGKVNNIIEKSFNEINNVYNKWNPNSELSHLNSLKANIIVKLSPAMRRLMEETKVVFEVTRGRFDPTIEPLQAFWKEKLQDQQTPSNDELNLLARQVGWQHIHLDDDEFYKDRDGIQMDFGGIAKGLGIDLITERLIEMGLINIYVEWGGEIRANGKHPDDRPWTVFISRLGDRDPASAIAIVQLQNQAIATSGDYLQNWTLRSPVQDKITTFFHIFNPISLRPLEITRTSVASVSVVAPTCAFADGIATAAMMFSSVEEAQKWLHDLQANYPAIKYWVVSRDSL